LLTIVDGLERPSHIVARLTVLPAEPPFVRRFIPAANARLARSRSWLTAGRANRRITVSLNEVPSWFWVDG
jgi:hypothetical protein